MSMQRITISLPEYLYDLLVHRVPARKVSQFATQAIEKELVKKDLNPIEDFILLRKKLPKKDKAVLLQAIEKGRT